MQTRFEVNRLSKNHISAAYEKLVPIIRHEMESKETGNNLEGSDCKPTEFLDEQLSCENNLFSYLKRNNQ